jgi:hypothetical protein
MTERSTWDYANFGLVPHVIESDAVF